MLFIFKLSEILAQGGENSQKIEKSGVWKSKKLKSLNLWLRRDVFKSKYHLVYMYMKLGRQDVEIFLVIQP